MNMDRAHRVMSVEALVGQKKILMSWKRQQIKRLNI